MDTLSGIQSLKLQSEKLYMEQMKIFFASQQISFTPSSPHKCTACSIPAISIWSLQVAGELSSHVFYCMLLNKPYEEVCALMEAKLHVLILTTPRRDDPTRQTAAGNTAVSMNIGQYNKWKTRNIHWWNYLHVSWFTFFPLKAMLLLCMSVL